jgi:DNA-binding transcriptional LysR family regulator
VSTHSTPQAVSALKNGLVDLAVVTTPVSLPRRLKSTIITNFQEVAVCGSSFADLTGRKLSLAELTEKPLICLDEHTKTYEFYSNLFMKKGLTFSPIVEATTIDQILPLVRNNLGIGFVPELFLKNFSESDQVYRLQLKTPIPKRDICAVKRTGFALNMAARKLEEMILQAC